MVYRGHPFTSIVLMMSVHGIGVAATAADVLGSRCGLCDGPAQASALPAALMLQLVRSGSATRNCRIVRAVWGYCELYATTVACLFGSACLSCACVHKSVECCSCCKQWYVKVMNCHRYS